MKKQIGILLIVMFLFGLVGCQNEEKEQTSSGAYDLYEGYISVKGNQLFVNDFEFIDLSEQYWINKLELTTEDMPNGYYIYDTTTNLNDFLGRLDMDGSGDLGKTPFRIRVLEDGRVLSISEIFIN